MYGAFYLCIRYDFSDGTKPVSVSPVMTFETDPAKASLVPYTVGALDAKQVIPTVEDPDFPFVTETQWVVCVSKDGTTAEFHSFNVSLTFDDPY